jgi:hypothetical protein
MTKLPERTPLYTAHFGMQVFFNGDFYTLCNLSGGITATVNRPIAGMYFQRFSLSIPELIDVTEILEWLLLHSGIPISAAAALERDRLAFNEYLIKQKIVP